MAGATNQSYTPLVGGEYAVVVSLGGCKDTSSCHDVNPLNISLKESEHDKVFNVYPNPAGEHFTITLTQPFDGTTMVYLSDVNGRVVLEKVVSSQTTEITTGSCPSGVYYVKLVNSNINVVKQVVVFK